MSEEKSVKGFFEFLISAEAARFLVETASIVATGPLGVVIPVAGRAIEYYGPAVVKRIWSYKESLSNIDASRLFENVANLDKKSSHELAHHATKNHSSLISTSDEARRPLEAVLSAIPVGLTSILNQNSDGSFSCPVDVLTQSESEFYKSLQIEKHAKIELVRITSIFIISRLDQMREYFPRMSLRLDELELDLNSSVYNKSSEIFFIELLDKIKDLLASQSGNDGRYNLVIGRFLADLERMRLAVISPDVNAGLALAKFANHLAKLGDIGITFKSLPHT